MIFSIAGFMVAPLSLVKKLHSFTSSGGCITALDTRLFIDGESSEVDFSLVNFISRTNAGATYTEHIVYIPV